MSAKKAYLIVLDGFGLRDETNGNAIAQANTPYIDELFTHYPLAKLKTDGESVGLPSFQTGGSEVGHMTMSAGRQIDQLLKKINDAILGDSFFTNPHLQPLFERARSKSRIHFMGLCSDGGVHSYLEHLLRLQEMAKDYGISNTYVHAFLDGRDVGERTATDYLRQIDEGYGSIASLSGRYYGMDRDTNWDRTKQAYDVMCDPSTEPYMHGWQNYLQQTYADSEDSDYYVPPVLFEREGQIKADDIVIFFNFRTDRARQISAALCGPGFDQFQAPIRLDPNNFAVFGPYHDLAVQPFAFEQTIISNTLGELVAEQGGAQLRISETEKFNHVTFFFSGQTQQPFAGEDRILVPSPKCPSYAEKPEMSAFEQTDEAIAAIAKKDYMLVVQNYANADLVGHSGNLGAAIKAIEALDASLAKLVPAARGQGFEVFITADHGNAEDMLLENGEPNSAHSKHLVPFCWVRKDGQLADQGDLADVAPTILQVLEIPAPSVMTGASLIR